MPGRFRLSGDSQGKGQSVAVGSHVRRTQQKLLRNRPWCDFCERFGRHLDSASGEPPSCIYWKPEELDEWNVEAEAVIQTWELIRSLWPETLPPGPTPRPAIGASLIERVKAAYRVEDVARRLTDLHGDRTLTGKCPLHREENGRSFVVWPDIQRWRCYGACAKQGDVLDLWVAARAAGYRL